MDFEKGVNDWDPGVVVKGILRHFYIYITIFLLLSGSELNGLLSGQFEGNVVEVHTQSRGIVGQTVCARSRALHTKHYMKKMVLEEGVILAGTRLTRLNLVYVVVVADDDDDNDGDNINHDNHNNDGDVSDNQ